MELMIVVVLVGISASMVAPAVMRAMSISRANRCQYDLARLLRNARSASIGTGRAHLVDIVPVAPDMRFQTYIGDSNSCRRAAWNAIVVPDAIPIDRVWQSDYDGASDGVFISVASAAGAPRQICFEPDGDVFMRTNTSGAFVRAPDVMTVSLRRHEAGDTGVDVVRQIVIPQMGVPRVVR